jgi:hypothetical protein
MSIRIHLGRTPGRAGVATVACALALTFWIARPAEAELPDTQTLLSDLGFSQSEISRIQSGEMVSHALPAASDRELTTAFAFHMPQPPGQIVKSAHDDLLDRVDPNMLAFGKISTPAGASDFAKLALAPDADKNARAYRDASPGEDLNLSSGEIAAFKKLGSSAATAAVEDQVRKALLARVEAYRAKGLDGLAPYAREGGKSRSPAEELRTATNAMKMLAKYAPAAHQYLLDYPNAKPPGAEEIVRWSRFDAHGVPTIALTQILLVPDGGAWLVTQRQFYVSSGYNVEQAIVAFLPDKTGTVVVYANRTSTDQVTGFGGGTKRSIGSKLLASQIQGLFEKARKKVK